MNLSFQCTLHHEQTDSTNCFTRFLAEYNVPFQDMTEIINTTPKSKIMIYTYYLALKK